MSAGPRPVAMALAPQPVVEGAGVRLRRSFPQRGLDRVDPFLLFDDFSSPDPADFVAGFPMHPHRGIETVTYLLAGAIEHRDTLGNRGTLGAGDVQWMTAGRGILHEEMPRPRPGGIRGFQLWVNLPARLKMTAPRYQDVRAAELPGATLPGGGAIHVIAGRIAGLTGPVGGIAADPVYADLALPAGASAELPLPRGHAALVYLFEGRATVGGREAEAPQMLVLGDGDALAIAAPSGPARCVVMAGAPLGEPVARHGPFVMNTREEIEATLAELRAGTFARG